MAQTRPRFGGGSIMETKVIFSQNDLGRNAHNTDNMEASLHSQPCGQKVVSKGKQKAGEEKPPFNSHHSGSQRNSEMEVESIESKEESQINNDGCDESLGGYDEKSEHSFPSLRTHYVQNDTESRNKDFEKRKYEPEDSSDCSYKADVNYLMSILQSLGISSRVKPYVRSTKERDSGEKDGVDNVGISRQDRPIDLSTSDMEKKSGNEGSTGAKIHHESNILYCKNLFLKDRHGNYYLIIAEESAPVDFKILKKQLNAARNLSFADVTATENILGEKSGGVNPFVALRKSAHEVRFALHQSLLKAKDLRTPLAFHPLDRSLQIEITVDDLIAFLEHFNKQLEILPADLSRSATSECVDPKSDECVHLMVASKECKQSKIKAAIVDKNDDDSQAMKLNTDNRLLNPTIDGKPLWKMHIRKGKLKSLLKTTKDKTLKSDNQASQSHAAVKESSGKEPETIAETATPNSSKRECRTVQNQFDGPFSKPRALCEGLLNKSKFVTDKIEKPNRHPDSSDIPVSSTLPEITNFYKKLSDLCIDFKDLHVGMSTTRDIGPSIGCKCFFLKDRRQNYYLIITHEYYELDHGRLKKGLKPKKKLDHAEPADILENLGVQPSRITPFSCTTDKAIAGNVMVFMTEKIRPSEVILCTQHPFAEGRRLIMKSGELQRYLSCFVPPIGTVEEKAWPEKYDRIFTRFTDQSNKQTLDPEVSEHTPEQQQIGRTEFPGLPFELKQQTGFLGEKEEHNSSSTTEKHRGTSANISVPALLEVCRRAGKAILFLAGIDTHLISRLMVENIYFSSNGQTSHGSSVDPSAKETQEDADSCLNAKENMVTRSTDPTKDAYITLARSEDENVTLAAERTTIGDSDTTENVKHGEYYPEQITECELNGHNTPRKDKHSDTADTSLTVRAILHHLRNINVDFTYTDSAGRRFIGDELNQHLLYQERNHSLHESNLQSQEHFRQLDNDGEDIALEMSREKCNHDDKKTDDHDNVEICSTAYMFDKDNHYIVVGGESDYLTKRRFRRLFHLPGPMQMGGAETPGLTTSPFSLALKLREKTDKTNPSPNNIYVILFTSLYLDPETKCVFHLDPDGSTLTMTSLQFEYFINKTGMDCWYLP